MVDREVDLQAFPHLAQETVWPWGPIRAAFELLDEPPPEHLISNVNLVPYIGDRWLIIRSEKGWGITGGTLEPGEHYLDAIKRELLEEAGADLLNFTFFGAWHCYSLAPRPYRPHLPHPEFYRVVGYGEVAIVGSPQNPQDGEQIIEVSTFPIGEACRLLNGREDDGTALGDIYRLAAFLRE
jgi:8-oxo-dGTP diphosphatase